MKKACETMLSLYPNQSYPLEILCSHYLATGKRFSSCLSKRVVYSEAFLSVNVVRVTLHIYDVCI